MDTCIGLPRRVHRPYHLMKVDMHMGTCVPTYHAPKRMRTTTSVENTYGYFRKISHPALLSGVRRELWFGVWAADARRSASHTTCTKRSLSVHTVCADRPDRSVLNQQSTSSPTSYLQTLLVSNYDTEYNIKVYHLSFVHPPMWRRIELEGDAL